MSRSETIAECTLPGWEIRLKREAGTGNWLVIETDLLDVDGNGDPYDYHCSRATYYEAVALFNGRVYAHLKEPRVAEIIQLPKAA